MFPLQISEGRVKGWQDLFLWFLLNFIFLVFIFFGRGTHTRPRFLCTNVTKKKWIDVNILLLIYRKNSFFCFSIWALIFFDIASPVRLEDNLNCLALSNLCPLKSGLLNVIQEYLWVVILLWNCAYNQQYT